MTTETDERLLKVVMWVAYGIGFLASLAAIFSHGVGNGIGPIAMLGGFLVGEQIKLNRRLKAVEARAQTDLED